jgi:hypothetical protein
MMSKPQAEWNFQHDKCLLGRGCNLFSVHLRRFSLPDGHLRFSKSIWPLAKVILVLSDGAFLF